MRGEVLGKLIGVDFNKEQGTKVYLLLDIDGTIRFYKTKDMTVTGNKAADTIGMNLMDFVHPEDKVFVKDIINKTWNIGETSIVHYRVKHQNGNWVLAKAKYYPLPDIGIGVISYGNVVDLPLSEHKEERSIL